VLPDVEPPPPGATGGGSYVEHLRVPLRWWAIATMFWASVLLALLVAIPVPAACAITGFFFLCNAAVFAAYGAARISLDGGVLEAGRARIPVHLLAAPRRSTPHERAARPAWRPMPAPTC